MQFKQCRNKFDGNLEFEVVEMILEGSWMLSHELNGGIGVPFADFD